MSCFACFAGFTALPGGLKVGDEVYYAGAEMVEQNARVSYGCHGVVKGPATAGDTKKCVNVCIDGCTVPEVAIDVSMLSSQKPTEKLAAGFQVGDLVFYLGQTMQWPSGDKVAVGIKGVTKGPGANALAELSVLFEGNKQAVSLQAGQIMPADPRWVPHTLEGVIGRPGGA